MAVVELIDDVEDYSKRGSRLGERENGAVRDKEMLCTWQVGAAVSKFTSTLQGDTHGST